MSSVLPVLQSGLLRMRPTSVLAESTNSTPCVVAWRHRRMRVRVCQACVTALAPWKDLQWFKHGVTMGMIHRRKVVSTDSSDTSWGALCEGRPTFGSWSDAEGRLPGLELGRVTFKMYYITVTNYFIKKVFNNVIQVPQYKSNVI